MADDFEVAVFQHVVGLEQERAGAAGRVDDLQIAENSRQPRQKASSSGTILRRRLFRWMPKWTASGSEAFLDQLVDRVLDDAAGELGRRVIDAELLAFDGLRHGGEAFGAFSASPKRPPIFLAFSSSVIERSKRWPRTSRLTSSAKS